MTGILAIRNKQPNSRQETVSITAKYNLLKEQKWTNIFRIESHNLLDGIQLVQRHLLAFWKDSKSER